MNRHYLIKIFIVLIITGCSTTSRINDYSTSVIKTLRKYEELGYTFDKACKDRCYLDQVKDLKLIGNDCNCDVEQTADSVTSVLFKAIRGYYDGLLKLSNDNVTTYKTQALTKQLKSGNFGDLRIDTKEVDAYSKLSNILLKAFSDGYRNKKLKSYIEIANEPIQILLTAIESNLTANLTGKLNVHKARMQSIYFNFLEDSAASAYEKKNAIEEYHTRISEADLHLKQINSFAMGLKSIRAGHQKLFDNRDKIQAKEMKSLLAQYASDLDDILSDFNKLKIK